jgi:hypothetical protein
MHTAGARTCLVAGCISAPACPQWRIENFNTLSSEAVWSDCFEAGISTTHVVGGVTSSHVNAVPVVQRLG